MLTNKEKHTLLNIARESIASALQGRTPNQLVELTPGLRSPGGAFVTLKKKKQLRGCIGYIESQLPIAEVVADVAVKAAFEDPRFEPITKDELSDVRIEVSVLSSLRRMERMEEVEIGVHGLLLELKGRRGLLLPQVATEYHLDRESFLEATARKAGLAAAAWSDPHAVIHLFSAEVFHEPEVAD